MMTAVQPYLDLILKERSWSWAIVSILYILAALFVRGWFVGPLFSQLKTLDSKHRHKLKQFYLKASLLGWLFFFLPIILIVGYWEKNYLPIVLAESLVLAIGLSSFILSVILHLQAFGGASLQMLKSLEGEKSPTDH